MREAPGGSRGVFRVQGLGSFEEGTLTAGPAIHRVSRFINPEEETLSRPTVVASFSMSIPLPACDLGMGSEYIYIYIHCQCAEALCFVKQGIN